MQDGNKNLFTETTYILSTGEVDKYVHQKGVEISRYSIRYIRDIIKDERTEFTCPKQSKELL